VLGGSSVAWVDSQIGNEQDRRSSVAMEMVSCAAAEQRAQPRLAQVAGVVDVDAL